MSLGDNYKVVMRIFIMFVHKGNGNELLEMIMEFFPSDIFTKI